MTHPQKGKGHKHPRRWHRGRAAGRVWRRSQLPSTGTPAVFGEPVPNRRGPGGKVRSQEAV